MSDEYSLQPPPSARRASHAVVLPAPLATSTAVNGATDNSLQSSESDASPKGRERSRHANISRSLNSPKESRQALASQSTLETGRETPSHSMSGEAQPRPVADADTQVPKQITYLMALTDQVLTKRTQIEHEEGTLDQQQQYLNESSRSLLQAFVNHLPRFDSGIGSSKTYDVPDRSPEFPKSDLDAFSLPPPPGPPAPADRHAPESTNEGDGPDLQGIANNSDPPVPSESSDPVGTLWALYRTYETDYEALRLRRAKVAALRNELTGLEYRLRKRQGEFLEALKSMKLEMPQFGSEVLERASEAMGSFVPSEPSKSDAPSLLAQYFDQKGNVGIYRDRLIELDYYFQEGLVERELILDRGDELENSEEQFKADYMRTRQGIERDLVAAEREAASLAAKCYAQGIDITNPVRRPSSSIEASSLRYSEVLLDLESTDPVTTAPETKAVRRRKVRIEGWLQDIQVDNESHEDAGGSANHEDIGQAVTKEMTDADLTAHASTHPIRDNALQIAQVDDT